MCKVMGDLGDLDLTFDIAVVTLTFNILSRLYFRNSKQCHGVIFNLGSAKVFHLHYLGHISLITNI